MVEVLAFLFENFLHRQIDLESHMEQIAKELPQIGFNVEEIDGAIDWLGETLKTQHYNTPKLKESQSIRAFTELELAKIDKEARGMIYFLENSGFITPSIRELLIDRAMALKIHNVGKEEMRWVLLFVLMNDHAQKDVIEWIEASIAEGSKDSETLK